MLQPLDIVCGHDSFERHILSMLICGLKEIMQQQHVT
jgi:hypothetical protein